MKFENSIFEEDYLTSFTHTGIHDTLTNKSFLSLMENLAGMHSASCHFSFADIAKENLSWIILSWKLQVFKRPTADEKVTVKTWLRDFNKVFVLRDFKVINSKGELCAIATSKWCLIDTLKGKIAKLPVNLDEIYHGFINEAVFDSDNYSKLYVPESAPLSIDTYKIRRFDLDINRHVHNLNYLNFAYELLPLDVFEGKELNNLEIIYKREIKYGETIKSSLYREDDSYIIVTKNEEGSIIHSIVRLF